MKIELFGRPIFNTSRAVEVQNAELRSNTAYLKKILDAIWDDNGIKSQSGVVVTDESALRFSAVFACVRLIANSIGALPLHVYERTETGREVARKHPIYPLLHTKPGLMNSMTFRQALMFWSLLHGNGYARIWRDASYPPTELELLKKDEVEVLYEEKSRSVFYRIREQKQRISAENMIHVKGLTFDGIIGMSVLSYARESIGLSIANQNFGSNFFKNGTHIGGFFEHPGTLKTEVYDRLKKSLADGYSGIQNTGKSMILEDGMKFSRIGIPPEDAQFLQSRKFQISDIARFFGVQPHKIGDLEKATNNNIEMQSIEFVQDTLLPWLVTLEQEFNDKLFREDEKDRYYCSFNVNGLLRGDTAARGEFYSKMFQIGALNLNEIRARENENSIAGGEKHFIPVNLQELTAETKIQNDE